MYKVLIIEDDSRIGLLIKDYFTKDGFEALLETDGIEGYIAFNSQFFDLIILDVMLPGIDGFEVAHRIRKNSNIPIIMVTARSDDEDQIKGYSYKIDDYITKPFNPDILLMKANILLERVNTKSMNVSQCINIQGLFIDCNKRKVLLDGQEILLEPKQFNILKYLIDNKNKVVTREELLNKIWGYDYYGNDRVVDTQIRKLRKSLQHKAYLIKTAFSVGYSFEED
jgi:DNA-binding response OmpR family regulator